MAQRDHGVEQLSPEYLGDLERSALLNVACNWVHDLKEMREQANQNRQPLLGTVSQRYRHLPTTPVVFARLLG